VAEGDTIVSQSDHGSDQKGAKSGTAKSGGQVPTWPKWSNGPKVPFGGSGGRLSLFPFFPLTREHRGFFYSTLDHAREAGKPLAPFWGLSGAAVAASCCMHACKYLFHGNHLPLPLHLAQPAL